MKFSLQHDLHTHTVLSACCADPRMTVKAMAEAAMDMGYETLCLTDHLWDGAVPGASKWYAPQDIAHLRKSLPLPNTPGLKLVFGCEAEYCGGDKLSLAPEHYDYFDWIVVPLNHFHMAGLTRPVEVESPADRAALFMRRLEELLELDLPWPKVGIAHFTCGLLDRGKDVREVLKRMDRDRLERVFAALARRGAGIELNSGVFLNWRDDEDGYLWPYRLAKQAGCKLYCASDAHDMDKFLSMRAALAPVVEALGLTEEDRFVLRRD